MFHALSGLERALLSPFRKDRSVFDKFLEIIILIEQLCWNGFNSIVDHRFMEVVLPFGVLDDVLVFACGQVLRKHICGLVFIVLHLDHAEVIAINELGITIVKVFLDNFPENVWSPVPIQLIEKCLVKVIFSLVFN